MVKKFFIWETNSNSKDYPNYVYYGVDYSPSRASKLNREIKVSDDKKHIEKISKFIDKYGDDDDKESHIDRLKMNSVTFRNFHDWWIKNHYSARARVEHPDFIIRSQKLVSKK